MRIRLWLAVLAGIAVSAGITGHASATALTFDDIPPQPSIPNGYGGLNWTNWGRVDTSTFLPSGYGNGVVSGAYVAYNPFGLQAVVGGSAIDFDGAYLTAAWNDGLNIEVRGYLAGALKYDRIVTVDTTAPTFFNFDYQDVDLLKFDSFGGSQGGFNGAGTQFAMDNFTYSDHVQVPEPATLMLVGAGMLCVSYCCRKRDRKMDRAATENCR